MSPGENLVLTRQLFGWFNDRDIEALLQALDEEVHARTSVEGGAVLTGRAAVAAWWEDLARRQTDVEARPLEFEPRGSCVVVRGYLRQRTAAGLAESQTFWLYEFRGGKIVRAESHPSRTQALAAC